MKLTIIILFVLYSINIKAQWDILLTPFSTDLHCVYVVDSLTIYSAGSNGKIYKSIDNGNVWFDVSPQFNLQFSSIYFVDANVGWVGGQEGTIAKTTNGGSSWELMTIYSNQQTNAVLTLYFSDKDNGYLAGGNITSYFATRYAYVYKTTNSGETWEQKFFSPNFFFSESSFLDINTGYVAGPNGVIFKTTNGGNNWSNLSIDEGFWIGAIFFHNSNNGFILGQSDVSSRTVNGGLSWIPISIGTNAYIETLYFQNENNGWAGGVGGNGSFTTNGGLSWQYYTYPGNRDIIGLHFNKNIGFAVGRNGTVLRFNSAKSLKILQPNGGESLQSNFYYQIRWNKNLINKVLLDYTTNNGQTWNIIDVNITGNIYNWFVPYLNSNQCKIRITDADDPTYYIVSDSNFTIYNTTNIKNEDILPNEFKLFQNYPNPFNPNSKIRFSVPSNSLIILNVYNTLGQLVSEIVNKELSRGVYEYDFNSENLPSGTYYYKLIGDNFVEIKKMNIIK